MRPVDQLIKAAFDHPIAVIEQVLDADAVFFRSEIRPGIELIFKGVLESFAEGRHRRLAVILDTPGGVVEVVERMVSLSRKIYDEVDFIIPNRAMSAGTVFSMSGDRIIMDDFAVMGPIDPQIEKDGKLIPALSYLVQYERLVEKARKEQLTSAELVLLSKLDLAELHVFEEARKLSEELLEKWLAQYKFKDWERTEQRGQQVTGEQKRDRAKEIAAILSDNERWHSHGRGIDRRTLREVCKLRIDALEAPEFDGLEGAVRASFELLDDFMQRERFASFVFGRNYF